MDVRNLPALNALLNFTSAFLVVTGIYFIRRQDIRRHRAMMIAALGASSLFLISYLYYHYQVGSVSFQKEGWIRGVYFSILITHTVLAAVVVPLVVRTAYLALSGQIDRHRRSAKWTFPIWIYVSVTGVVVYLMLYQF